MKAVDKGHIPRYPEQSHVRLPFSPGMVKNGGEEK